MLRMLWADKFALCAAIFLIVVIILAFVGPAWLGELATKQNLRGRNLAPFQWQREWYFWLGRMRSVARCWRASSPPRKIH